jgi:eukaryotic-like serine/threonine-protein kinase
MSEDTGRLVGGRYRLGEVLGRGGMGTVWRGRDETLGRSVAVKELRFPSSVEEDEKQRLITRTLREAKAIARIRSGSAVTVFDVVDEDGRPWIVMELVEGVSLADRIRKDGPLTPRRAAEVGLAVLDVLRAAHREGVLHRDVKPSNVLLEDVTDRVVLTDFGIAKVEGDPSVTSTGMLVGAPSYISPERARGKPPGPPADLWSLGALLYAAVEGHPPYDKGSAITTLAAVMTEPVPPPQQAGELSEVIAGLLMKDPEARLDVDGARALLEPVASDSPPVSAPGRGADSEAESESASAARDGGTTAMLKPKGDGGSGSGSGPGQSKATSETRSESRGAAAKSPPPSATSGSQTLASRGGPAFRRRTLVLLAAAGVALLAIILITNMANGSGDNGGGNNKKDGATSGAGGGDRTKSEDGRGTEKDDKRDEQKTPGDSSEDASDSGDDKDEESPSLPAGYTQVTDKRFHFSMAMPKGFKFTGTAGSNSGAKYSAGGLPKLQVDFSSSPLPDAAAGWRKQEPAVKNSSKDYRLFGIKETTWRGYETVADWQFERREDGRMVHVLNRGFKVDSSRGYAIMITCTSSSWKGKECRTLRDTAFKTFKPLG